MVLGFGPYQRLVKGGEDPAVAWEKTKDKIYSRAKFGTWRKDYFIADPDEKGQRYCHINEIKSHKTESPMSHFYGSEAHWRSWMLC